MNIQPPSPKLNSWSLGPNLTLCTLVLCDQDEKLEGIARLERKLEEVTTNFHGELDYLKAELSNLSEARNRDGAELNC